MGLFTNFRKEKPPKNTDSVKFKRWMAQHLNEKHLRYVFERGDDNVERVLGQEGFTAVVGDDFVVHAGGKEQFRTKIDTMTAWEFMSLQGATITGFDQTVGRERTVLIYYSYYIK